MQYFGNQFFLQKHFNQAYFGSDTILMIPAINSIFYFSSDYLSPAFAFDQYFDSSPFYVTIKNNSAIYFDSDYIFPGFFDSDYWSIYSYQINNITLPTNEFITESIVFNGWPNQFLRF